MKPSEASAVMGALDDNWRKKMKTKTVFVTLSEAEMDDFRKVAEAEGISMRELARKIILNWLKSPDVQAKLAKDVEEGFLEEKWK